MKVEGASNRRRKRRIEYRNAIDENVDERMSRTKSDEGNELNSNFETRRASKANGKRKREMNLEAIERTIRNPLLNC